MIDEEYQYLLDECKSGGLITTLGITYTEVRPGHAEAIMPITPTIMQPYGFVHGGATLSLLETVASAGARTSCDLEHERPFGVGVDVRLKKSGVSGVIRGVADLDHEEPSSKGGMKQFWHVAAYDDEGDVLSEGLFVVKVVSLEYLEQRAQQQ